MENKVSVIIPVYNTEKYIKRCFTSIMAQTYNNIELCIANDASTDASETLILEFAKQHPNLEVKYICHQSNKGSAAARNSAMKLATGKYIHFLDSDDFIEPNTYKDAIEKMTYDGSDACIWGWDEVTEDGDLKRAYSERYEFFEGILSGSEVCKQKMLKKVWIWTASALYSANTVRESMPLFFQGLNMGEDFYCICKLLINSQKVSCIPKSNSRYVIREGSMVRTAFSPQNMHQFKLFLKLKEEIEENRKINKIDKKVLLDLLSIQKRNTFIDVVNTACYCLRDKDNNKILECIKQIPYMHENVNKSYYKQIVTTKYRLNYLLFCHFPTFYFYIHKFVWKVKELAKR